MPPRRNEITMSNGEVRAFLAEQTVMQCATLGRSGRPHLVPLWYVPDGVELLGWTYARSQKARNLERDPRATVGLEDGSAYQELRGAMLECDVELAREEERVAAVGLALVERYHRGPGQDEMRELFRAQARKRVGLRFVPTRIVSWDHRKLGGGY
jgi:PPOX class probable F420-dependent enzyme